MTVTNDLSDLLECVATFGRSLDRKFDPAHFLSEFSARAQRLVPSDYMLIQCREDDGWIPQSIATPKTNRH
jgi:hypothetical protein